MKTMHRKIILLLTALWVLSLGACKTTSTGKSFEMLEIKGGSYTIGGTGDNIPAIEGPSHEVTLSNFSIGKYEVTLGQFKAFVEASGYITEAEAEEGGGHIYDSTLKEWIYKTDATWKNPYITQNDNHPVVLVSWNDAVAYCNWLSQKEGYTPAYTVKADKTVELVSGADGYRLPTEAEWEYACRAGTKTAFNNGKNTIGMDEANFTYSKDDSYMSGGNAKDTKDCTVEVGSYKGNPWEVYDMHGNVREWCWDWYGGYPEQPVTDPLGPETAINRVTRGGSWGDTPEFLRSSSRGELVSRGRGSDLGFRVARTVTSAGK